MGRGLLLGRTRRPAARAFPSHAKAIIRTHGLDAGVSLLAALGAFSLNVISTLGYAGVFVLMTMESMVLPVPSEAVLPFAGFLATPAQGRFSLPLVWLAALAGSLLGSLLSYGIGVFGLRPLLERYGKLVLVTPHHLDAAHAFFERRSATVAILVSRFVPVVRHLISIPAGSSRMPLSHFLLATAVGAGAWDLALLYAGYAFGRNYDAITAALDEYRWWIVAAAIVVGVVTVVAWRRHQRTATVSRDS
jgi:membrane protein DedA with SNARE-associated domain